MLDQIIIGATGSVDSYDASVASREIGEPTRKSIKETVPFSNVTHDFSKINGEIYYDERELKYTFEIIADTPSELESKKTAFKTWVMNVFKEKLYDPFIDGYHFIATHSKTTPSDDESMLKTTLTVTFTAYPYKIADTPTTVTHTIAAGGTATLSVNNGGAHRITPTITLTDDAIITFGGTSFAAGVGTYTRDAFALEMGANSFVIQNQGTGANTVTIFFCAEVF